MKSHKKHKRGEVNPETGLVFCGWSKTKHGKKPWWQTPERYAEIRNRRKEIALRDKEKIDEQRRAWNSANRERVNRCAANRRKQIPLSHYAAQIKHAPKKLLRQKERYRSDPNYRMTRLMRNWVFRMVRMGMVKRGRTREIIGCSAEELRAHIASQFKPGMTWDNHGVHGWHIDHIRPLSSFDLTDQDQLKQATHYTNLAPLWAYDNLIKGAKICA